MIRQIRPASRKALEQGLKRLKLRHTRDELEALSDLALSEEPSYLDFLAYVVEKEISGRKATQRAKRLKAARFPAHRTLEGFDFTFQTSVSPQTMRDLAALDFIAARENALFIGPPVTAGVKL